MTEEDQAKWMLATAVEGVLGMLRGQQAGLMKDGVARDVGDSLIGLQGRDMVLGGGKRMQRWWAESFRVLGGREQVL